MSDASTAAAAVELDQPPRTNPSLVRWRWISLIIFPGHLLLTALTMGLRPEHFVLDLIFLGVAWLPHPRAALSRQLFPLFLTAVAYDNGRYLKYLRGSIHVGDLYRAELRLFGIATAHGLKIPAEFLGLHTAAALDFICGLAYMIYLYELVALCIYLAFRDPPRMSRLAWAFFAVNVMGLATYVLYPAAPPWYALTHGLGPAQLDVAPSAAGAARFDALLGISYFQQFYARNPNVFGAMPSLHVAYPTLCFLLMRKSGVVWALSTAAFALLVGFSAVYLQHHYVLDVVAGATYALIAHALVASIFSWRKRLASAAPA